jgi:DNA-binding NtrC family response regulator
VEGPVTKSNTPTGRVLVIDDDDSARTFIARSLTRQGFSATSTEGGREAIGLLNREPFDAIVCDLLMPEVDGLDVLRFCSSLERAPPFLMLTAHGNVGVAVDAMKLGAVDFLEKPVGVNELSAALRSALGQDRARRKSETREAPAPKTGLVGSDSWLGPFTALLERIATSDAIVLVEGETGTGKSAVAREVWRLSRRSRGPFVEVNCAAIGKDLMENELFGHVKGAFTGAVGQAGKVEKAAGGTLFLDEIGELPLELQAKLLQLLQERTFTPVGASSPREANVRFIAATNRQLEQEARRGTFRPDLYYRLEVVKLTIPPLRDRLEDIPILLEHFRRAAAERNGRAPIFPPETIAALSRYDWPGNVRELENLVSRLSVMLDSGEEARVEHLPDRIRAATGVLPEAAESTPRASAPVASMPSASPPAGPTPPGLADVERDGLAQAMKAYEASLIRQALERTADNVTRAAKILGMKRTTLIEKRKRYEELGLL